MTEKLIIGFDAKRIVRNGTGLGSYGRTLANDLARREDMLLRLYAPDKGRDDLRCQVPERENLCYCFPKGWQPLGKSYWRSHAIVSQLQRDGIQLFHGLSGELPVGIRHSGIKSVVTIHDLIFLRHPEFYHWIDTKIYAWKFRQTVREADHIIAISECTKRDIMELGHVDERRISVVYQSYAPRFKNFKAQDSLSSFLVPPIPELCSPTRSLSSFLVPRSSFLVPPSSKRYLLSVGTIERRKNILLAVKALPLLPEDLSLVIIGRHTPYADEVKAYAEKHGLADRVIMLHNVSNAKLPSYYAHAEAFVYPSVYEGFGIPIIEAISSGLPVVACTGSCLEEAGGPDSLYVSPTDVQGMAAAILQSLRNAAGREQRIQCSQAYIRRFEGANVAEQVADIYQRLLL